MPSSVPGTPATRWASAAVASVLIVSGAFLQGRTPVWINAFFLAVTVVGTLCWDLATAFIAGARPFLSEWYLVYTSGPAVFMLLYLGHAAVAAKLARVLHADRSRPGWSP